MPHYEITYPVDFPLAELEAGEAEVWIQVFSDDLLDWARTLEHMPQPWKKMFERHQRRAYYPATATDAEREKCGKHEDWWVFRLDKWQVRKLQEDGI